MNKNSIYILFTFLLPFVLKAQTAFVVYNDGLTNTLQTGITCTILGGYTSQTNVVDGTIDNQSIIQLTGHWANNNTGATNVFSTAAGTVKFIGTTQQTLSGSAITQYFNVEINNTTIGGGVTVAKLQEIAGALLLTDGVVTTSATSPLVMKAGSSSSPGSETSHVDGLMRKEGTTAFIFPTGNLGVWARIGISTPTSLSTFEAQYFFSAYANVSSMATTPSPVFSRVSSIEHWNLSRCVGTGAASVTMYWENATRSGITSVPNLKIARWNGAAWENTYNATSAAVSAGITGNISTVIGAASTIKPFAFGTVVAGSVNPLPVELLSFDAKLNEEIVDLFWETATEINNDYFTVEKSKDGIHFKEVLTVEGSGNSNRIIEYFDIDYKPLEGVSYYRLKQTDFDGRYSYSNIVPVKNLKVKNTLSNAGVKIYPNPSTGNNINVELTGYDSEKEVLVIVRDITGKEFYSKIIVADINGHFVTAVDLNNKLAKGTYIITGSDQNNLYSKKLLVK